MRRCCAAKRDWQPGWGSSLPRPRPLPRPIEQIPPLFFLRVIAVLDLQPPDARVIGISEALRDDTLEIIGAHQMEQLAASALDGERLGYDR